MTPRISTASRTRRLAVWTATVALVAVSGLAGAGLAAAAGPDGQTGTETATVTTTDPSGRSVTLTHPRSLEPGADLVISGTGWQLGDASAGSLVNVLLDARFSGDPTTVHTRRTVLNPVTGKATGDTRSQALVRAGADGSWTARIPYPTAANARLAGGGWADWAPGSEHEVRVLTGSLLAGDVTRSVAGTFTIGTVAGGDGSDDTDDTDTDDDTGGGTDGGTDVGTGPDDTTTCRPTSARPTVRIETPVVSLGGELEVSGAGWCHPEGGGSRIGVKIDEGALARTDDTVHANRTIWAIVQADARTGTFRTRLRLPDGTAATSTPALTTGAHTLRLLSGTLRSGDTLRSVLSEPFSIGRYRPAGTPAPLEAGAELRPATRGAVAVRVRDGELRLRVPRARAREWVFVTAYAADGSPRYPWARWFRLDDARRVALPGAGRLPAGRLRLSVQSGDQDRLGRLLGWAPLTGPSDPPTSAPGPGAVSGPVSGAAAPTGTGGNPGVDPLSPVPAGPRATPAAPARDAAGLRELPRGGVRAEVDRSALRVLVPGARPGEAVHVRVYPVGADPVRVLSGGWVVLDADSALRVRVRGLAGTEVLVAVQAADGSLLGWAPATPDGAGGAAYVEQTIPAAILDEDAASPIAAEVTDEDRSWFTAVDAGLLALGALALAGAVLRTRRRTVAA
ncbi:hypothetical protein GHK92_05240 [Nocardioides sp. dk4132]|uniref:hypothetical protein n=1 Tax=unclassified Nocardioides TaxID=2615069 RepID=UPI001295A793|nr:MULTISPECIES: hypothetical protein [unclassified Nocardioides]MQW75272.1 hypothetical protein [Nocardioides sp. dk4132]QGA07577.1 hypothetical protein GFH29_09365 [Nocardioides sp. dk884]